MGTYKHIGRLRSARKVGLSLASYYMEGEEYNKATTFLVDALKTFQGDRWTVLVIDVLLKLAECYHAVGDKERYIRTCAQIACSQHLDIGRRNHFFDEMMTCLTEIEGNGNGRIFTSFILSFILFYMNFLTIMCEYNFL